MTEAYRIKELERARKEANLARAAWKEAKTLRLKRVFADDMEFWTNKASFLSHVKGE